jgi:broad specificity phosphatase PhoE
VSAGVAPPEGLRTTSDPTPGATRIVLVRHGQGEVNVTGVIGGPRGCTGLSALGRSQVEDMARRLASSGELRYASALYASVLPRAIETAELLAPALGLPATAVVRECELCELHPGEADGLVWEEFAAAYEVPDWDVDASAPLSPGGESWNGFVDRCGAALEALARRHPGELVVVGTHAGFIEATVIRHLVGSPAGATHPRLRLRTAHASLTEWEHSELGWRLLRYNDAHTGA